MNVSLVYLLKNVKFENLFPISVETIGFVQCNINILVETLI
jgi:hypothetical protein